MKRAPIYLMSNPDVRIAPVGMGNVWVLQERHSASAWLQLRGRDQWVPLRKPAKKIIALQQMLAMAKKVE